MLQDPSQFAEHIDAMLKQSLGIGDEVVEEDEEIELQPEAENAEEEAEQDDDDDEDKSSKDELWMNVSWKCECLVCLFFLWPIHYYGRALKLCYTVKWNLELRREVFVYKILCDISIPKGWNINFTLQKMRNKIVVKKSGWSIEISS